MAGTHHPIGVGASPAATQQPQLSLSTPVTHRIFKFVMDMEINITLDGHASSVTRKQLPLHLRSIVKTVSSRVFSRFLIQVKLVVRLGLNLRRHPRCRAHVI